MARMIPLEERRIETAGGIGLHTVFAGPADGPVCLLLHGFPESWYAWRRQIEPLAKAGFRVVVPDLRGYGRSDKPRGIRAYRIDRLAADIEGLLDGIGTHRAHLAAHDWGGAVAWYLATRSPDRLERLAVLNVPHPLVLKRSLIRNRAQLRRSWYIFFFQLPWLPELWIRRRGFRNVKRMLRGAARSGAFPDEDLERYVEELARPGALTAAIHWYRAAFWCRPPWPVNRRIPVPVRIVWGRRDTALGEELVEPSAAFCDRAEVIFLDDAGHFVQHDAPERVARLLIEHFGS